MKKLAIIFTFSFALCLMSAPAHAWEWSKTEDVDHHKMWYKFKRGVINVFTSPVEIPKQIKYEVKENADGKAEKVLAAVGGTVKGLAYTAGRLGSGLWDMISCNLAVPEDYEPLMYPEYVNESSE